MERHKGISAFFPAYNDGGTIASMVITAITTLRGLTDDYEVIVVQNGSTDYTKEVLDELEKRYPELRVLHFPNSLGYGGALRMGFASATKELVFYTDGDAQYDPRELKLLLPELKDGVDVVNGYKISRSDPITRIMVGKLYQMGVRLLFGLRVRDVDCDFRLIRRSVFDHITLYSNSGVICVEMMKKIQDAGFKIAEVPVHHYHRTYGESQFFTLPWVMHSLAALLKFWWGTMVLKKWGEKATPEKTKGGVPSQEKEKYYKARLRKTSPK